MRRKEEQRICKRLMECYDQDQSGELDREELRRMLRDYAEAIYKRQATPNDDDLDFIIFVVSSGLQAHVSCENAMNATHIWSDMLEQGPKVKKLLKKYDTDGSCTIEAGELRKLLREMNDFEEVLPATVTWIMAMGDSSGDGQLNAEELVRAIAAWYGHLDASPNAGAEVNGSGCCIVM